MEIENGHIEAGSPAYDLGVLIGDVSEGFYYCSYNDHDVFCAWKNKILNRQWAEMSKVDKTRCGDMKDLWEKYYPEGYTIFDWEGLFDRLFALVKGWPTGWLSNYETLEQLATQHPYQYDKHWTHTA